MPKTTLPYLVIADKREYDNKVLHIIWAKDIEEVIIFINNNNTALCRPFLIIGISEKQAENILAAKMAKEENIRT